mmetsp:Transcript_27615/g.49245  ORF Transcript_27615/g.49245 Transcript_27615/m.49245 type:complete len:232 (-) Transcript_27615:1288-1983(-)
MTRPNSSRLVSAASMEVFNRVPSSFSNILSMPCRFTAFMSLVRPLHSFALRNAPVSRRLFSAPNIPFPKDCPVKMAFELPPASASSTAASSSIFSSPSPCSAGASPAALASSMSSSISTSPSISRGCAAASAGLLSSTAMLRQNSVASVNWMPSSPGSSFTASPPCLTRSATDSTLAPPELLPFCVATRRARARLACSSSSASSSSSQASAAAADTRSNSDALLALSSAAW